jgi:hypothetical protein
MWTCPKCSTKIDPTFDVCWSCGTSSDGVEDPTFVPADAPAPEEEGSPTDLDMPMGDEVLPVPATEAGAELVDCYWALDLMQAKFLADQLTANDIPAVADTHDMHDALGSMSSGPRVWVRAVDLDRAKAWLDAYDEQYKAEHGEPERD